jgi:hypothetical protein
MPSSIRLASPMSHTLSVHNPRDQLECAAQLAKLNLISGDPGGARGTRGATRRPASTPSGRPPHIMIPHPALSQVFSEGAPRAPAAARRVGLTAGVSHHGTSTRIPVARTCHLGPSLQWGRRCPMGYTVYRMLSRRTREGPRASDIARIFAGTPKRSSTQAGLAFIRPLAPTLLTGSPSRP